MGGLPNKKRRTDNKAHRPTKKQRRIQQYNSDSDGEGEQAFDAVNLLDSDDDIHNVEVDDGADVNEEASSSEEDAHHPVLKSSKKPQSKNVKSKDNNKEAKGGADEDQNSEEERDDNDDDDNGEEEGSELEDDDYLGAESANKKTKSKRSDPAAFATSLSKILSTKLSNSKRADPVLSRSSAAHQASKAAVDMALEAKAKRRLKEQRRIALEKGRVKDVLVPEENTSGDIEMSTADILDLERKLRKTAQRGVVRLFNAVRTAQVKAAEAEKGARKEGLVGVKNREEKVNELSKKGFLDLIASGGGGLKKGPLEEA